MGKRPCEWHKIDPHGKKPIPRYGHTLNFYEKGNYLILHGGRNDLNNNSFALNDTWLLELTRLEWCEAILYQTQGQFRLFHRCFHGSVIFGDNLIIYGGMNNNNYIGSSLFIINLDLNSHLKDEFEYVYINSKPKRTFFKKTTHVDNKVSNVLLPPIK
jgi:hypothetical protein